MTGGSTLIVSLPKEWVKKVDLKPGDEVLVIPQPDLTLLIVPKKMMRSPLIETFIEIGESTILDHIERVLLSSYLSGCDVFRVEFKSTNLELKRRVKDIIRRKLIGVEIVEEGRNTLVIQNLLNAPDVDIRDLLNRLIRTISGMIEDLKVSIETGDRVTALDVIERDNEVDKFYWLLYRQLKRLLVSRHLLNLSGINDLRCVIEYAMINKHLERVADYAVKIARELVKMGDGYANYVSNDVRRRICVFLDRILDVLRRLGNAVLTEAKAEEANQMLDYLRKALRPEIEDFVNELIGKNALPIEIVISLRLILENMYKITEYLSYVYEALLNLTIEKSNVVLMPS